MVEPRNFKTLCDTWFRRFPQNLLRGAKRLWYFISIEWQTHFNPLPLNGSLQWHEDKPSSYFFASCYIVESAQSGRNIAARVQARESTAAKAPETTMNVFLGCNRLAELGHRGLEGFKRTAEITRVGEIHSRLLNQPERIT